MDNVAAQTHPPQSPVVGIDTHYSVRLAKLAHYAKAGSRALYQFAEVYEQFVVQPDFSYAHLAQQVRELHGVDIHSEGGVSKLRKVHRHFRIDLGIPLERLEGISPYKLYELLRHAKVGPDTVDRWLELARTLSREELIRRALGYKDVSPKMKSISLEENVYAIRKGAKDKLAEAAGLEEMSDTEFEEFMCGLIVTTDLETLRELWSRNH